MQPIYKPSKVPDQRTKYHFHQEQLDELNRRQMNGSMVNIKPSSVALEVKGRIDRKRSKA